MSEVCWGKPLDGAKQIVNFKPLVTGALQRDQQPDMGLGFVDANDIVSGLNPSLNGNGSGKGHFHR